MNSRATSETLEKSLEKYYQLPGHDIINQSNTNPKLFLNERGGNCSYNKNLCETFKDVKNTTCKKKDEFKFIPGDRILDGDYFKGWNDSFFFQTNLFRNNTSLWHDPFRTNYFQGK
jgi:hypothetical protein